MNKFLHPGSFVALAALLLAGCSRDNVPAPGQADAGPMPPRDKYLLAAEPAGVKGVLAVRKEAKDGDEVVIVGRVGGSKKPLTAGRSAFTIVDPSFIPCNEKPGDDCNCTTPWDYCCDSPEDLRRATAMIKVVDDQDGTIKHGADAFLGIQPLQTVVVRGKARRDDQNNLTVLATSLYIRPGKAKDKP
jgi:hypothetical protein